MCAFGVLHWKHELTKGFRLNDNGASIEDTPAGPPKAAGIQRTADVAIDDHGAASGKGRFVLSGQEALYWRQLALEEDAGTLAKDFTQYVGASLPDGLNADLEALDGLADYDGDLTGRIKLSGALGSSTGKRMIVPGFLFEARGKHPFTEEKSREVAVDLHYATMEEDEVTYHFPAGLRSGLDRANRPFRQGNTFRRGAHDEAQSCPNLGIARRISLRQSPHHVHANFSGGSTTDTVEPRDERLCEMTNSKPDRRPTL
jgi:hypothetical protein